MMKSVILAIAAFLCAFATMAHGSRVLRLTVSSKEQMNAIIDLTEKLPQHIDLWSTPAIGPQDVKVSTQFESLVTDLGLPFEVLIEDVEDLIISERIRIANFHSQVKKNSFDEFFEEYQDLDSINAYVNQLAATYPNLASTFVLGTSYEGRQILGIKIKANRGATKEFVFNGGIHSREWVGPATVLYMTTELLAQYGKNSTVTEIVDGLDWTIVPVLNPDGYVFSWNGDRLWRKNRQPNSGSACIGTDLNRNWPFKWNTGGSSALPCSDSYHGPSSNSGPETKAMVQYLSQNSARLAAYIDFHAYSQLLMYPWGYTTALPTDNSALNRVGNAAANALRSVYGVNYDVGSIANIIYVASGSSADYTYGELGCEWSFAFELRDTGRYGFLLPADQIIPSGIETFEALKVLALQGPLSA